MNFTLLFAAANLAILCSLLWLVIMIYRRLRR